MGAPSFLGLLEVEAMPLLRGNVILNRFPHPAFTRQGIGGSQAWLAVVILFWSWTFAVSRPDSRAA